MARGNDYFAVQVNLLGHPRIMLRNERRVEIRSKKGLALIALLATADTGERSRAWLQQKLWGAREVLQAQASLRRELSDLRKCFPAGIDWLKANHRSIALDLTVLDVDVRREPGDNRGSGEFLEGIDIPGEEDFEDWLREMRAYYRRLAATEPVSGVSPTFAGPMLNGLAPPALEAELAVMPVLRHEADPLVTAATRTLVEALSQLRWLPVVAPMIDRSPGAAAVSQRSRYVVEADIARDGRRALLSLTLFEMPYGKVLWSQTSEITSDAGLAELRIPLLRASNAMAQIVDRAEQAHRLSPDDDPSDFGTLLWRARHHLQKFTSLGMKAAGQLLRQAAQLKPHHGEVAMLRIHQAIGALWASREPLEHGGALRPQAHAALRGDPTDARGPLFLGILDLWQGNRASAGRYFERSRSLAPGFAAAHALLGSTYCLDGRPELGLAPLEQALDLSPIDPFRFITMGELATARLMVGDNDGCLRLARDVRATHPHYILAQILEVSALAGMERYDEAVRAYNSNLRPKTDLVRTTLARIPFRDPSLRQILQHGIDLASAMPRRRAMC